MDYTALKNEIINDPLNLGYENSTSDNGMLSIINAPNYQTSVYIDISQIQAYVDAMGLRDGIESATSGNPAARAASRLFSARYNSVDPSIPAFQQAMGGLVLSNLMSSGDMQNIMNMGTAAASRAAVLGLVPAGGSVSTGDISMALRGY